MIRTIVCLGLVAGTLLAAGCGGMPDRASTRTTNATVIKLVASWVPDSGADPAQVAAADASGKRGGGAAAPAAAGSQASASTRKSRSARASPERASQGGAAGSRAPAATGAIDARRATRPATIVPQFRYVFELDSGGTTALDFGVDQKLEVGDRVLITEGGAIQKP